MTDHDHAREAVHDAFLRVWLRAVTVLLVGVGVLVAAWAVIVAAATYGAFHYWSAWAGWLTLAGLTGGGLARAGREVRGGLLAGARLRTLPEGAAAAVDQAVTHGAGWRPLPTLSYLSTGVAAAFGGWALLGPAGAGVAVACCAYQVLFWGVGVPRQWQNRVYPLLRMRTARSFDQTPEI